MAEQSDIKLLPASEFPGPPPWHFQCRSVLIPITKSWEQLATEAGADESVKQALADIGDVPETTRASMDGQVAADLNYEKWLSKQPKAVQVEVLGPSRYALWKAGKAPLDSMIDQSGKPLTLAQLKAKVLPETALPVTTAASWNGYPMTALIRVAGASGLNAKQTRVLMTVLGLNPEQSTIYTQLGKGKKGTDIPEMFDDHKAELEKIIEQIKAGKVTLEQAEAAPTTESIFAPPPQATAIPKPKLGAPTFPQDVTKLTFVKALGGSTGAELVKDDHGNLFVRKKGASAEHLREEFYAEEAYRAMGIAVPESRVYETKSGPVKLAQYVEGTTLGNLDPVARKKAEAQLKLNLAADALLGNWDVIGLSADNVLVGKDGVAYRIDVGGSLRFRAMGEKKTDEQWSPHVTELWTLRDTKTNAATAKVFGDVGIDEIAKQALALEKTRAQVLAAVPPEVRAVLEKRYDNLKHVATAVTRLVQDKFKVEYADEFAFNITELRRRGIVDKFPKQMTPSGGYGMGLVDENGKKYGGFRGEHIAALKKYVEDRGGVWSHLSNWGEGQGGTSWTSKSEALRYWMAEKRTVGDTKQTYYWRGSSHSAAPADTRDKAKTMWEATAGSNKQGYDRAFSALHAFQYEALSTVVMPNVNQETGTIRLYRGEQSDVVKMYNLKVGEIRVYRRGMDSTSQLKFIWHGQVTVTDAPLHRAMASWYMTHTPGYDHGFFLGDGENEVFALLEGLPAQIVSSASAATPFTETKPPLPPATKTVADSSASSYKPAAPAKVLTYAEKYAQASTSDSMMSAKQTMGDAAIKFQTLGEPAGSLNQFKKYKAAGGAAESYADFVGAYFKKDTTGNYVTKGSSPVPAFVDPSALKAAAAAAKATTTTATTATTASLGTGKATESQLKYAHDVYKAAGGKQNFYKWSHLKSNSEATADELASKLGMTDAQKSVLAGKGKASTNVALSKMPLSTELQALQAPFESVKGFKPGDFTVYAGKSYQQIANHWSNGGHSKSEINTIFEKAGLPHPFAGEGTVEPKAAMPKPGPTTLELTQQLHAAYHKAGYTHMTVENVQSIAGGLTTGGIKDAIKALEEQAAAKAAVPQPATPPPPAKPAAGSGKAYEAAKLATNLGDAKIAYGEAHITFSGPGGGTAGGMSGLTAWKQYKQQGGKITTWLEFQDTYLVKQNGVMVLKGGTVTAKPFDWDNAESETGINWKALKSTNPADMLAEIKKMEPLLDLSGLDEFKSVFKDEISAVMAKNASSAPAPKPAAHPPTPTGGEDKSYDVNINKAATLGNAFQIQKLLGDPVTPLSGSKTLGNLDNFNTYQAKGGKIKTYTDFLKVYFKTVDGKLAMKLPAGKLTGKTVVEKADE